MSTFVATGNVPAERTVLVDGQLPFEFCLALACNYTAWLWFPGYESRILKSGYISHIPFLPVLDVWAMGNVADLRFLMPVPKAIETPGLCELIAHRFATVLKTLDIIPTCSQEAATADKRRSLRFKRERTKVQAFNCIH